MKKLLLILALAAGTGKLMAQDKTTIPNTKLYTPYLVSPDTALKVKGFENLVAVPQNNLKLAPQSLYDLKGLSDLRTKNDVLIVADADRMPVAKLPGKSNMPVIMLRGNSNMPVVGKPAASKTITLDRP